MPELLQIEQVQGLLTIDARQAIRTGHHPRGEILSLVREAPTGTVCEIHVPHRTAPLIAELEGLGLHVAVSELEPGHFRLRALKL